MSAIQQALLMVAPAGAPASMEWVGAGAQIIDAFSSSTPSVPVHASTQVGDYLLVVTNDYVVPTSVVASNGQTLTLIFSYISASEVCRVYGVIVAGTIPTSVTVNLTAPDLFLAQSLTARGVTQVAGTYNSGNAFTARTDLTFDSDTAEVLVLTMYTTPGSGTRAVATASFAGGGGADINFRWSDNEPQGLVAGVHDGSTGTGLTFGVTWNDSSDAGGRWMSLALKP